MKVFEVSVCASGSERVMLERVAASLPLLVLFLARSAYAIQEGDASVKARFCWMRGARLLFAAAA